MSVQRRFLSLCFALLLFPLSIGTAQEKVYKGKVYDSHNYQYSLTGLSVSGVTVFHLRVLDTEFRLDLEKIRSLTVVPGTESPYQGYVLADVVLRDGAVARAWVDFENYWIEGVDDKLGVVIKIKLTDIVRLDLTTETLRPAPAPVSVTPL